MKITFIIGGARSGKSTFALSEASRVEGKKAFIATAEALDDEMRERIGKHRLERSSDWNTYEEPMSIGAVLTDVRDRYSAVAIDCLTIWLSNVLVRGELSAPGHRTAGEAVEEFIDVLRELKGGPGKGEQGPRVFIVSNEVGAGIVPGNKLARQFRDLSGTLNQKVAEIADEVFLVAAGVPVKIK